MLMLTSAIGSFEILDLHQSLFENLVILYEDFQKNGQKENQNICCLIHCEDIL